MSQFKVIIYDCDGVLLDTREANLAFYNHILARFGLPPLGPDRWELIMVLTAPEVIRALFQRTPYLEEAQAYQLVVDNRPFLPLIRPEPQVREVLAALRPRYRLAVATNRGKSLPLVLREHGLDAFFDLTVSSLEVTHHKPHPECLLKILHHFQVQAQEALYIGDSAVDQETSEQAGVAFAAYRNQGLKARYHLREHQELLAILRREPPDSSPSPAPD